MEIRQRQGNPDIIHPVLSGLVLLFFCTVLADGMVSLGNDSLPLWSPIAGAVIWALCALALAAATRSGRRAYQFQFAVTGMFAAGVLPFLAASFELTSWSLAQIAWVSILCCVNGLSSFRSTLQKLSLPEYEKDGKGRLNIETGFWDISKNFFSDADQGAGNRLARVLIPLASGLGAILYRVSPDIQSWAFAGLTLLMMFALISLPATHAAAGVYLMRLDRRLGRPIRI